MLHATSSEGAAFGRCAGRRTPSLVRGAFTAVLLFGSIASCGSEPSGDPCRTVFCSMHGTCHSWVGSGFWCDCQEGYHPSFDLCEVDDPSDPCAGVRCSDHGRCVVVAGEAACQCDEGYVRDSGRGLNCLQSTGDAPVEVCNGVDDTADGRTDEGFDCVIGDSGPCTTSCGTTGQRTCTSLCFWSACAAPPEVCNGRDDDCDTAPDEDFVCVAGAIVGCETACDSAGTGTCTPECGAPAGRACTPPSEACNGWDDDCDGATDEGGCLLRSWEGDATGDRFGSDARAMSDFDGDGWPDILVGAPSAGTAEQGAIYKLSVRTGAPLGTSPWSGDAAGDEFGCCVSDSLDATGDGIPDYVVGAPKRDDARPGSDAGMAYLYDGRDGSFIAATGQGGGHSLYGGSVSLGPDVDGDGLADIVVGGQYGDPSGRSEAGAAYVYSGASRSQLARLDGRAAGDHFGGCVSLGPDADGDTRGDILIGARNADPDGRADAGVAYLYSGSTFGVLHEWRGSEAGAQLGYSVRAVPDFDGDGRADALIGIPFAAPSGIVRLFSGSGGGLIRTIAGGDASASFGATVDGRLDADGDDVPDILVGAPNAEAGRGRVFLYSGADGRELLRWTGEAEGDHLGRTAAYLVPDINGDDLADVIVTASDALEQRGKVYVFSGPELSD